MLSGREVTMEYFDLHCDTLYKATIGDSDFYNKDYHISLDKTECFDKWVQLFAIWIPDDLKGSKATELFNKAIEVFDNNCVYSDSKIMHLAVENASMLAGSLDNINLLVENHIRYVTLTWNGENELGCGASCNNSFGITSFGKDVVRELEKNNIAVDVSHASDKLFYDVIDIVKNPVIATHSNSRSIYKAPRNLTDDQFKIIRDMGGIVGLNFYKGFLNDNEVKASIDDLLRHADHFLNLGGENTLAIGSDFDGADMPEDIYGIDTVPAIYKRFCDEFGAKVTKKVFFDNANMYFTNFDIIL